MLLLSVKSAQSRLFPSVQTLTWLDAISSDCLYSRRYVHILSYLSPLLRSYHLTQALPTLHTRKQFVLTMFHSASVTSSFILTSAVLLAGTSQVTGTPLPQNTATPQGTACQVSVFKKSQNRDVSYCNGLFDAVGNCGFGGYRDVPAKNIKVPEAWGESKLPRISIPKSLWDANVNSDPSIINNLCGSELRSSMHLGLTKLTVLGTILRNPCAVQKQSLSQMRKARLHLA